MPTRDQNLAAACIVARNAVRLFATESQMFGKTYSAKAADIEKKWVLIDAKGLVVGRLASLIAVAAARQAQAGFHAASGRRR